MTLFVGIQIVEIRELVRDVGTLYKGIHFKNLISHEL